jgi:hypothetical protein
MGCTIGVRHYRGVPATHNPTLMAAVAVIAPTDKGQRMEDLR